MLLHYAFPFYYSGYQNSLKVSYFPIIPILVENQNDTSKYAFSLIGLHSLVISNDTMLIKIKHLYVHHSFSGPWQGHENNLC